MKVGVFFRVFLSKKKVFTMIIFVHTTCNNMHEPEYWEADYFNIIFVKKERYSAYSHFYSQIY